MGSIPLLAVGGHEEFKDIRQKIEPRVEEWIHRPPSTLLGQGKWLLQHPHSDLEQICFALKLLSMSRTSEANDLLANFYLSHSPELGCVNVLSPDEWHAAGVSAGKAFVNEGIAETADRTATGTAKTFRLPADSATALVRAAVELIKQNPAAFPLELAELRSLNLANAPAAPSQEASNEEASLPVGASPLAEVAEWLLGRESVTLADLRTYLLPLDLLPSAVIDQINERALDLSGDLAFEEFGEEIIIDKEVLSEVLTNLE